MDIDFQVDYEAARSKTFLINQNLQKEIRIKFHLINAMSNKGIESVPVEATGSVQGLKSITTDEEGFAEVGPFIPGESFTAQVTQEDFDDVSQVKL